MYNFNMKLFLVVFTVLTLIHHCFGAWNLRLLSSQSLKRETTSWSLIKIRTIGNLSVYHTGNLEDGIQVFNFNEQSYVIGQQRLVIFPTKTNETGVTQDFELLQDPVANQLYLFYVCEHLSSSFSGYIAKYVPYIN